MNLVEVTTTVVLAVPDWPVLRSGTQSETTFVHLQPETAEISYVFRAGGIWRVGSTTVRGLALARRSLTEVSYPFGDHRKTIEMVAAEVQYYPRENPK